MYNIDYIIFRVRVFRKQQGVKWLGVGRPPGVGFLERIVLNFLPNFEFYPQTPEKGFEFSSKNARFFNAFLLRKTIYL